MANLSHGIINHAALNKSLVAPPKHPRTVATPPHPPATSTNPAASHVVVVAARKERARATLARLFNITYPASLVEGNDKMLAANATVSAATTAAATAAAPASVQAGMAQRRRAAAQAHVAAALQSASLSPPDRTRTIACNAAHVAADAALARYHQRVNPPVPIGDEDGMLSDVIELSLAMDLECKIDDWCERND